MTKNRKDVISLLTRCWLSINSESEISELIECPVEDTDSLYDAVFESLFEQYEGVTNGFLSELYYSLTGNREEVVGEFQELCECPCCGFKTLSELYDETQGTGYDICDFCNWEDDGTTDASAISSVNNGSMSQYREKLDKNKNFYYRVKWKRE